MGQVEAAKLAVDSVFATGIFVALADQLPDNILLAAFAGVAGGVARWAAEREKIWPDGIGTVTMGLTAAVFLWPLGEPVVEGALGLVPSLDLEPATAVMLGGFVTGLGGVSIIKGLIDLMRRKMTGDKDADGS